jgi:hypothetical protein
VATFQKENPTKRPSSARSIAAYFIVDSAPKQINLKAPTRAKLLEAVKANDEAKMSQETFFDDGTFFLCGLTEVILFVVRKKKTNPL